MRQRSLHCVFCLADGVAKSCSGDGRQYLESLCDKLPEEDCLPGMPEKENPCDEHEFHCGDGQCIPGLGVCDYKYQCMNGADELKW